MERGWEWFHWRAHNLTVSHCSGHVHSSCQRQKKLLDISISVLSKINVHNVPHQCVGYKIHQYPFTRVCLYICVYMYVFRITNLHCISRKQSVHLKRSQFQNGIAVWSVSTYKSWYKACVTSFFCQKNAGVCMWCFKNFPFILSTILSVIFAA